VLEQEVKISTGMIRTKSLNLTANIGFGLSQR
jgi:hypothetical protein